MSKILITMKDFEGIDDSVANYMHEHGFSAEESDIATEIIHDQLSVWFDGGEYVRIEVDLETNEARVVPVGEA